MIEQSDIDFMKHLEDDVLLNLINSKIAVERSTSVRILSEKGYIKDENFVKLLLKRLNLEKSLYTKLEICRALKNGNEETAKILINYLGTMGNNQHKNLPKDVSKKVSYPLPRDIIARVLCKMNTKILGVLLNNINFNDEKKISELIDAIGFLVFYNIELSKMENLKPILDIMNRYSKNKLIMWKCTICLSAFPLNKSINVLEYILTNNNDEIIIKEAKRSLKLINSKIMNQK
ncbi:hypothetical protein [Methanococcus vannielii]|nr:hypothetical protein [Methanococcus vannielii]